MVNSARIKVFTSQMHLLKIAPTAHAGLGCKSIFNFGRAGHGAMLDAKSTEGGICEDRTLAVGCLYEFYYVI